MKTFIPSELVRKAQRGQTHSLEELLVKSENLIRSTVSSFFLGSEAEDVVQEVRVKIFEDLTTLDNPEAYHNWVMRLTHNQCINALKKKKPVLLGDLAGPQEDDEEAESILESEGFGKTSDEEFKRVEEAFERRQRIEKVIRVLESKDIELLRKYYVYGFTLEEISNLGDRKKTYFGEKIKISKAQLLLEAANEDWRISNFEDAKRKLIIIASDFKPDDDSIERSFLLASALTRLGDIHQVQGQIQGSDRSIDFFLRAKTVWDGLHDKKMAAYAIHMMALCHNILKDYPGALKLLEEAKEGYSALDDPDSRRLSGDLERDIGSIYINMEQVDLAKSQTEKSITLLEDVNHRESFFAALRKRGEIETRLGQFEKAHDTLLESTKFSPQYRALHHLQTKIALVKLSFVSGDINQGVIYGKEAAKAATEYGFLHQLAVLNEILTQKDLAPLN